MPYQAGRRLDLTGAGYQTPLYVGESAGARYGPRALDSRIAMNPFPFSN